MELSHYYADQYSARLHHKQSAMAQRIFKFKSRQKTKEVELMHNSMSYRQDRQSVELPSIRR